MINLKLGNSNSQITGLSDTQFRELRELLSYKVQGAFFAGKQRFSKKYLISSRGEFPSGLLRRIEKYLKENDIDSKPIDTRIRPTGHLGSICLKLPYHPYPEQLEIASTGSRRCRGTISAVTGFGKSIAMALLIDKLKVKTLIIVPNLELKNQLTATFKQFFGDLSNITIKNIDSKSLQTDTDYDCLIIDEAHHVAAKTYRDLNKKAWEGIYYRFFFTATPFRSQDEEQLLFESIAGEVIYRVDYKGAVRSRYICPLEAYYVDVPKTQIKGNIRSWPAMYSELVVNNANRNMQITDILLKLHANNLSTLCLVKEIKHGEILSSNGAFNFVNGQTDENHLISDFNTRKFNILVGTTGVLGEGVDTKPCEYVIIAGLGKSKNQFMQQCGRAFRRYIDKQTAKVILFRDGSHKWTLNHFKAQCKILKEEYGVIPIKLEI